MITAVQVILLLVVAVSVAIGAARFQVYCLTDLDRRGYVRLFSRETWRLVILVFIPLGGLLYLTYGKARRP
ncbi:hypothetical protein [Microtetraspora fusca]|uniref:Cardiolipin synthase N-terminal domain-containing protein n=1 Tax=Microtetraspora fusca TaxID=1997 RepID=A0ABW6V0S7_MICFU|nr:hypothetical protein [Microtetraspora fusca]